MSIVNTYLNNKSFPIFSGSQTTYRTGTYLTRNLRRIKNFRETVSPFFKQNSVLLQKYFLPTLACRYLLKMKLLHKNRLKFWGNYSYLNYGWK